MISQRIKDMREKQGISQVDMAARLGVTQQAVSYWESGIRDPRPAVIVALANVLNCTTDYLLGRTAE